MSQTSGESAAPGSTDAAAESSAESTPATGRTAASRVDDASLGPGFIVQEGAVEPLLERVQRLERRIRLQFYALVVLTIAGVGFVFDDLLVDHVIVQQKLMESKGLTLLDNDGNVRLFVRMYSKVPVLQIMDTNGKPRMSLGLRFDDSPFVDLSDRRGRTRATFEITEDDAPALRMFDANGNPTFNIN
jgi:hypothetical protein